MAQEMFLGYRANFPPLKATTILSVLRTQCPADHTRRQRVNYSIKAIRAKRKISSAAGDERTKFQLSSSAKNNLFTPRSTQ